MTRTSMDLANTDTRKRWDSMLAKAGAAPYGVLTQFEQEFVDSMIQHTNHDTPIWNPSLKQWNFLHQIVSTL